MRPSDDAEECNIRKDWRKVNFCNFMGTYLTCDSCESLKDADQFKRLTRLERCGKNLCLFFQPEILGAIQVSLTLVAGMLLV